MSTHLLIDGIGWVGALAYLLAYALLVARRLASDSNGYQWLNLLGAVGVTINVLYYRAFPSVFMNVVWGAIALAALWRQRHRKRVSASR